MRKILYSLTLSAALHGTAQAQDVIPVSWDDIEQKSLDKNLMVKLAEEEINLSKAELLEARAMYLPNVNFSYTLMNTNSPLMAFGTKLNQERVTMEDFDPNRLNNPKSITDFATKFEVQQPIFNWDAVQMKKAGKVKTDALKIKQERTVEHIQFEVKKAYMMLQLAYKMKATMEKAKSTTLANKKVVQDYFDNGMLKKSDLLYVDVRLNEIENHLQVANSNIHNASDFLSLLLNEDTDGKVYEPQEELAYAQETLDAELPVLNPNRKDILAYNKSLEAYDWMIKSSKAKYFPRLNAFGSYELHDKKFTHFRGDGYLVGLQLAWNVFDGLKGKSNMDKYKAEINKTKAEINQYTQQSSLELRKAYRDMQDAAAKVGMTKKSWDQSKEAYRILKDRFDQGLEKSSDLLISETKMSEKELEYQNAIFEYNVAQSFYQLLK